MIHKLSNIISMLFLASCGQPSEDNVKMTETSSPRIQELEESFKLGETVFKNHCQNCHVPPGGKDSYIIFEHLFERMPSPPEDYFIRYIQDSKKIKKAGDSYASKLDTLYNSDYEHLFKDTLSQRDMKDLIVYIQVGMKLKSK